MKTLIAIPVFNEEKNLPNVLPGVLALGYDVLAVDDGSTDRSLDVLARFPQVAVHRQPQNRGYGAALRAAFAYAERHGYGTVVTFDGDGQHDASLIPQFVEACAEYDVVSGSRYMQDFAKDTPAPADRRRINMLMTDHVNAVLGLQLTDTFCGFKAYRTDALAQLHLTEDGYASPMEFWVEAACHKLRIAEIPVPRVYLDPNRSFGETLDDSDRRLAYYQQVFDRALKSARQRKACGIETATRSG